jgi:subtilisin-like proprotein convertase family protein
MQSKFTRFSLVYFSAKVPLLMLAVLTSLFSFSQSVQKGNQQANADKKARTEAKMKIEKYGRSAFTAPVGATNDVGLKSAAGTQKGMSLTNRTEAVCQTYTGSLAAGDNTMAARLFRGGIASTCAAPTAFPTTSAVTVFYDTYTYTNTTGLTQCGTFTLTTTDLVNANIEHGIWDGSFNPANLATNYLADPGLSTGTPQTAPLVFSRTINAGQTIVLAVWSANASSGATGTASNYTVTIDFPICSSVPCSTTPTPGNTLSTASTVCPGINFTLTLQNATAGSGVTYQWQSAPSAGGPWTDIPAATGSSLVRSQTAATCYRCNVTCAGNGTGTSTPVCVALTPPSGCYCTPSATDCTDDDVILRVRLSTLDNASTCGTGPPAGYTNYTSTVPAPVVYAGAANPLTVNVPTTFTEFVAAWIDYNQDGIFDASEYTNLGSSTGTGGTLVGNINIPSTALTGVTRMRVRVRFATVLAPTGSCLPAYTFGETEDYNVNIQPCVPITITGQPANASTACGGNASFSVTTTGSLPVYRWEYRPNASSAWQFVPSGAPYSGENTSTLTITNASQAYSGYQYRATVVGGCSATDVSNAATLTVTPLVATVTPTSATICTGTIQQITLTNLPTPSVFSSGPLNTPIPDNTANGISNTIAVAGLPALTPSNITVRLNLPHTYPGDMIIHLRAPNGNILNLYKYNGGTFTGAASVTNAGWYDADISSTSSQVFSAVPSPYRYGITAPAGPYKADAINTPVGGGPVIQNPTGFISAATSFNDLISILNGNWTLALADGGPADLGSLSSWSISFSFGAATGVWSGPAGTMWTDATATTAYTGTLANTIWVTPSVTSNYTVSYTTPTPCTSATTTVPVNVVNPAVLATSPVNRTVCDGGSTTFTATGTGGPLTYQWQRSIDGGLTYTNISGATSSTYSLAGITLSMTGYRYRCVISAAPCAGSVTSAAAVLTVNALPVVTLTSPDLLLTPGQTTSITASSTPAAAAGGWVWNYNGNTIAGNNTNTVSGIGIDQTGTYHATVTDVNGCSATSADIVVGSEASDRLWIYPNPTTGAFQVRLYYDPSTVSEKRAVYIYNAQGQLMTSREFDLVNTTAPYLRMDFDLGKAAAGTYVVKVVHKFTGKIVSGLVVVQ